MDKISFVDYQSRICSPFLNTVSDTVWDALGQAKTPTEARQFIGAVEEAPLDGNPYVRSSGGWVQFVNSLTHNQIGGRSDADSHPTAAITGLDNALAGKAPTVHTHTGDQITDINAVQVAFSAGGTIAATTVQGAISELDSETQSALSGKAPASAGTAAGTSFTPAGDVAATNVQAAIQELDTEKAPLAAGTAIGTTFTPAAGIAATNVQAAIEEVVADLSATNAGEVLQTRFFTDAGVLSLPATLANVTQTTKNFTPKSSNSTIKVSVSFYGYSSNPGSFINVQIKETVRSPSNVGGMNSIGLNPSGVAQSILSPIIEGLLTNNALTPLGFQLWANNAIGAGAGAVTNQVWTITEVQN